MKYRAEVDGLRALAVLPVIFFHAGFDWFSGGFIGVDVFFVISGYLITTIIISEMDDNNFSLIHFYERRARRILPALFLVMTACLFFAWAWLTPNELKAFGHSLIAVSTFSSNILFWLESGYFDSSTELKPLLHTWSLAVEEQYYILFPIFLLLTWQLGIRWIVMLLVMLFAISLGAAHWGAYTSPSANFYLLPTRGWELLMGVFAALYLKYNAHPRSIGLNQVLSFLGFSMIVYAIIVFDETTPFPSLYALVPTIGTGLLILSAVSGTIIQTILSLKPIVGIGLISYSAYLWHQPLLAFAKVRLLGETSDSLLFALCIASLLLAWISWQYVEKPFRNRSAVSRKFVFSFALGGISFFLFVGFWIDDSKGGLKYHSLENQKIFSRFFDPGEYVVKRHQSIILKTFNKTNSKKNILIIGDSHSEDIVNAVFEADINNIYDFSSFYIPLACGVLFRNEVLQNKNLTNDCHNLSFYNDDLQRQMLTADEIWIASSWQNDDLNYMNESLQNIKSINNNILLFGRKYFGTISPQLYLQNKHKLSNADTLSNKDLENLFSISNINKSLHGIARSLDVNFFHTQQIICNGKDLCSNYLNGDIITYDGDHLTPFGAATLGAKLKNYLSLRED
jgi:peptidoglycan/LPS O-acetylase OafA/YrhL